TSMSELCLCESYVQTIWRLRQVAGALAKIEDPLDPAFERLSKIEHRLLNDQRKLLSAMKEIMVSFFPKDADSAYIMTFLQKQEEVEARVEAEEREEAEWAECAEDDDSEAQSDDTFSANVQNEPNSSAREQDGVCGDANAQNEANPDQSTINRHPG